jgi:F-type H+-transporting ATPase subunit epsilon
MSGRISLEVVTPTKIELKKEVDYVVAPTIDGIVGVLPGHIRLLTQLATGVLRYQVDGINNYMAVSEGFMEVAPHKVIILAEAANLAEHIDVEAAFAEKREAEAALHRATTAGENMNLTRLEVNLERAITKVSVAKKYGEPNS